MKTCEAILITHAGYAGGPKPGELCGAKATHEHCGRAVCWLHHQACTTGPRATGDAKPVRFAESRAATA